MLYSQSCTVAKQLASSLAPAPLPSLTHFTLADYNNFYEPSDDTFLLVDALAYDIPLTLSRRGSLAPPSSLRALEIGSGSGVNIVTVGSLLLSHRTAEVAAGRPPPSLLCFATDVNPHALSATKSTVAAAGYSRAGAGATAERRGDLPPVPPPEALTFQVEACDLLGSGSEPWWADGGVDFLVFNPPYVPTPDEEVAGDGIEASWAGGERGRRVLDRAAGGMARVLREGGVAYVIAVDDNRPMEIIDAFKREYNLEGKVLLRRQAKNEFLSVLRFQKPMAA